MLLLMILVLSIIFLPAPYFIVGWYVRKCATRTILVESDERDKDGKPIMIRKLKPIYWCFIPQNTTASLQRKGNDMKQSGEGSKATPASGSGMIDMIHAVPGKILDRSDRTDLNNWNLRNCTKGEEETHRRGLFYYLYGVHFLGTFTEIRIVKVREVRLSIDEKELQKYQEAQRKWEDGGRQGNKPHEPTYKEHVKSYETLFPYFSREHDVAVLGSETAGAFALDIYQKLIYEETYPGRARTEVSDPNATLSTMVEQSVTNMTQGHQPEYYLFEKVIGEDVGGVKLKDRKIDLAKVVEKEVREQALPLIGIHIKKYIQYSIDMDERMRELLELQERTEREEQARILTAKHEIEVTESNAKSAVAAAEGQRQVEIKIAEGKKQARILENDGEVDHIDRVVKPLASIPNGPSIRWAESYEKNKTVTSITYAPGKDTGLIIGTSK